MSLHPATHTLPCLLLGAIFVVLVPRRSSDRRCCRWSFWESGIDRYTGYRPLGFFEDGNQYAIWVAATALAAVALWQTEFTPRNRGLLGSIAAMALITALMSQSMGAILLLLLGHAQGAVGWSLNLGLKCPPRCVSTWSGGF